jgi:hypothetical protein
MQLSHCTTSQSRHCVIFYKELGILWEQIPGENIQENDDLLAVSLFWFVMTYIKKQHHSDNPKHQGCPNE